MCGCEPGFTCTQCVDTPFDPAYLDKAHEPMDTGEFDALINEDTRWTTWNGWV